MGQRQRSGTNTEGRLGKLANLTYKAALVLENDSMRTILLKLFKHTPKVNTKKTDFF